MAFSFNWAGLQVPQAKFTKAIEDEEFGANLGRAARGYENRQAAKEYARKIDQFRKGRTAESSDKANRIAAIKAEIAKLESENADIEKKLNVPQTQQESVSEPAWSPTEEELQALIFDPELATKEDIITMQQILKNAGYDLGTYGPNRDGIDGSWGKASIKAFEDKYGYLWNPGEGKQVTFNY